MKKHELPPGTRLVPGKGVFTVKPDPEHPQLIAINKVFEILIWYENQLENTDFRRNQYQ